MKKILIMLILIFSISLMACSQYSLDKEFEIIDQFDQTEMTEYLKELRNKYWDFNMLNSKSIIKNYTNEKSTKSTIKIEFNKLVKLKAKVKVNAPGRYLDYEGSLYDYYAISAGNYNYIFYQVYKKGRRETEMLKCNMYEFLKYYLTGLSDLLNISPSENYLAGTDKKGNVIFYIQYEDYDNNNLNNEKLFVFNNHRLAYFEHKKIDEIGEITYHLMETYSY